jgi:hypothetical protein
MTSGAAGHGSRSLGAWRWAAFASGLAIALLMAWRAQAPGDAFYLLARGWMLVEHGWLVPFGNHMSGGGFEPGALTSLLVGLPLAAVRDFRAVGLGVLLTHLAGWLVLDRSIGRALGPRARLLLAVAYWLNPTRLYFSAHVWNPNWLFVLSAVHLATAFAQRERASFAMSFAHALTIGAAFELHGSFLILAVASVGLWWRGLIRVSWPGLAAGAAVSALALVPWFLELAAHPELKPGQEGFLFRGLVLVYPVLRAVLFWVRYASLALGKQPIRFDFTDSLGEGADSVLAPLAWGLAAVAGIASFAPSALATLEVWRRRRADAASSAPDAWCAGYVRTAFVATLLAFALSPVTPMVWQGFIVLHAPVLALVLWADRRWDAPEPLGRRVRAGAKAWAACALALGVALAFGGPRYRQGGRKPDRIVVREPHPMLEALGLTEHATVAIAPDGMRCRLLLGRAAWDGDAPSPPLEPGEKW